MELVANTMVVIILQLINVSYTRYMYNNLKKGREIFKGSCKALSLDLKAQNTQLTWKDMFKTSLCKAVWH